MLTIWRRPGLKPSLVLLEEGACCGHSFFSQNSVNLTLLHALLPGQARLLLQVSLDFLLFIPVPYDDKDVYFLVHTHTHTHTHLRHVERETPEQDKPNLFAARSAGVTPQGTVCARWRLREALESSPGVLPRTPTCSRHSSITRSFPGDFVSDSPSIAFYPVAVVQPLSHV